MANAKQNNMANLMAEHSQSMMKADQTTHVLAEQYRQEDKTSMMVSPLYQPYFGKVMDVCINGISIYMPIDGTTHMIPKTFADEIHSRILAVDAIIKKQDRMADVSRNVEDSPGELELV